MSRQDLEAGSEPSEGATTMCYYDDAAAFAVPAREPDFPPPRNGGRRSWGVLARSLRAVMSSLPAGPERLAQAGSLDAHTLADIGLAADAIPDVRPNSLWLYPAWRDHLAATGLRPAPDDGDS
jgi:hypothetical protein